MNAITGETGAGKTILSQAIGLLLGAKGDAGAIGADGDEAYVEAELDLPEGLLEEVRVARRASPRRRGRGSSLARRIFADGRTRAYAWGRSVAREDVAALAERLVAMSGQFEQRRLARPAYQLDVLDAFVGDGQRRRRADLRRAWRELLAARRRYEELAANAADAEARVAELRALVEDTEGLEPDAEESLRAERERLRHVTELASGVGAAVEALAPDEGEGPGRLSVPLRTRWRRSRGSRRSFATRRRICGTPSIGCARQQAELRSFLASLEAEPDRVEQVEADLDRIAEAKRRFRSTTFEELLARAAEARAELEALADGADPVEAASEARAAAERKVRALTDELAQARRAAAEPFADAVARELESVGFGEGEFVAELGEREPGNTGADEVRFLIRPNPGLPFGPVAETASGGELSRIALAIAAVGGGETMVFDEIDAGIGGTTAHAVGETLRRLAERAQVITITHLPQIASLADRHFRVEKIPGDPTHTKIERLEDDERRDELQRMLGGEEFLAIMAEDQQR